MTLNTFKCNHLTPLHFKGLKIHLYVKMMPIVCKHFLQVGNPGGVVRARTGQLRRQ